MLVGKIFLYQVGGVGVVNFVQFGISRVNRNFFQEVGFRGGYQGRGAVCGLVWVLWNWVEIFNVEEQALGFGLFFFLRLNFRCFVFMKIVKIFIGFYFWLSSLLKCFFKGYFYGLRSFLFKIQEGYQFSFVIFIVVIRCFQDIGLRSFLKRQEFCGVGELGGVMFLVGF